VFEPGYSAATGSRSRDAASPQGVSMLTQQLQRGMPGPAPPGRRVRSARHCGAAEHQPRLIADGVHVDPPWRCCCKGWRPGHVVLVSDALAPYGSRRPSPLDERTLLGWKAASLPAGDGYPGPASPCPLAGGGGAAGPLEAGAPGRVRSPLATLAATVVCWAMTGPVEAHAGGPSPWARPLRGSLAPAPGDLALAAGRASWGGAGLGRGVSLDSAGCNPVSMSAEPVAGEGSGKREGPRLLQTARRFLERWISHLTSGHSGRSSEKVQRNIRIGHQKTRGSGALLWLQRGGHLAWRQLPRCRLWLSSASAFPWPARCRLASPASDPLRRAMCERGRGPPGRSGLISAQSAPIQRPPISKPHAAAYGHGRSAWMCSIPHPQECRRADGAPPGLGLAERRLLVSFAPYTPLAGALKSIRVQLFPAPAYDHPRLTPWCETHRGGSGQRQDSALTPQPQTRPVLTSLLADSNLAGS